MTFNFPQATVSVMGGEPFLAEGLRIIMDKPPGPGVTTYVLPQRVTLSATFEVSPEVMAGWMELAGSLPPLTLTSADLEPPVGSRVRDDCGVEWVNDGYRPCCWVRPDLVAQGIHDPETWNKIAGNYGPVTVLEWATMADQNPAVAFLLAAHERAEALSAAGTPGPWEPEGDDPTDDEVYTVHDGEHGDLVGEVVAYVRGGNWRGGADRTVQNMQLIATFADPVAVLLRVAEERTILADCENIAAGWHYEETKDLAEDIILGLAKAWGWKEPTDG